MFDVFYSRFERERENIYIIKHVLELLWVVIDNFCEDFLLKIRDNNLDLDFVVIALSTESILYGFSSVLIAEEWKLCWIASVDWRVVTKFSSCSDEIDDEVQPEVVDEL